MEKKFIYTCRGATLSIPADTSDKAWEGLKELVRWPEEWDSYGVEL